MTVSHHRRALSLLALALAAVSACGDDDDDAAAPVSDADLDGKTFIATETEGHTIVEGSQMSITFTGGNMAVAAGCNVISADYSVDGDVLSTGELAATLMSCDDDLTAQQEWIDGLIGSDPTIELDDDQLVLSSGSDSITLEEA